MHTVLTSEPLTASSPIPCASGQIFAISDGPFSSTIPSDTTVCRIPLFRNSQVIRKTYCAFWKKNNSGKYIEDFVKILQSCFLAETVKMSE